MNVLLQYFFGRSHFINGQFISSRLYRFQPDNTLLSRHSLLTFAVSVMLNLLEIKYQGQTESPFEIHPKTMLVAVASVILYCFSYDANLRISSSADDQLSSTSHVVCVGRISMAFFGPLSLASLSAVLFPGWVCSFFLFSVSILFSLCEFPCFKSFRILWNWVQQVINLCPSELDRRGKRDGRRRRRRVPASVYLPRISLSEHTNELMEQVDILPV